MAELKRIKAEGSRDARIALIGEAPGRWEHQAGRPFVGPSWKQRLDPWWRKTGLQRSDFWIDNVYPFRPPNNVIKAIPREQLALWTDDLHERLAKLSDPWLIVACGDIALQALTEFKHITKHRGSIYQYTDRIGRTIKLIPTVHPAATFRQPRIAEACIADWMRIAEESKFKELNLPERETFINPTVEDLKYIEDTIVHAYSVNGDDFVLAVDAEWPEEDATEALMVGFATDPYHSYTIPTTPSYWRTHAKAEQALATVKRICESPIHKVMQHGYSDYYVLKRLHDIEIRNYVWDTLDLSHCLNPNRAEHSLEFLASILTRQPYWKTHEADFESFQRYNGLDCCVTYEIFEILRQWVIERGMMDLYIRHYRDVFEPTMDMMLTGMKVNEVTRQLRQMELHADVIGLQDELSLAIGQKAYAKKSLSPKKLLDYFYVEQKIPKRFRLRKKKTGEKVQTPTIDEIAIKDIMAKYPRVKPVGDILLSHRRKYALMGFYS